MWIDVEQNTAEWFELRAGRVGGSSIGTIMANYGRAFGDPAHKLAISIAIEQITGEPLPSSYTNSHMERGHQQEPIARMLYEEEYFCDVSNGGYFISCEDEGVSPDGLVSDDGMIEIKCVEKHIHFATVKRGKPDPKYKWQLPFNLSRTGRTWIDYVSFCSEFPVGKRLFVYRLHWHEIWPELCMIKSRMHQFRQLVEDKKRVILAA